MITISFACRQVARKIRSILVHDAMKITRLGLIAGSLLWAVQLLLPIVIFPTAAQIAAHTWRTTYSLMALVAPERVWGMLFLLHAFVAGYSLFSGTRDWWTLLMDGLLGCLLWTGSTVACYLVYWPMQLPLLEAAAAYPPPAAMSGEVIMAFYAWWHMVRHWAEDPRASSFYDTLER